MCVGGGTSWRSQTSDVAKVTVRGAFTKNAIFRHSCFQESAVLSVVKAEVEDISSHMQSILSEVCDVACTIKHCPDLSL